MPCNRETFEAVTGNPTLKASIEAARACLAKGDTKGYDGIKRALPAFCYMATFDKNKGKNGTRPENTWRLQSAARLNGLVMLDFDHLEKDVREVFASLPQHMFDDDCDSQILLAHVTPSGKGLRLVCKADAKRGNLADNQQFLSRCFKLECDASVKNADRMSFAVHTSDIIYLDKQIFDYQNDEYDKLYGDNYRGRLSPNPSRLSPNPSLVGRGGDTSEAESPGVQGNCPPPYKGGAGGESGGFDAPRFISAWLKENGTPNVGSRHLSALKLAADLRYFCDNNADNIKAVIVLAPFVQDIIKERGEHEIDDICKDVVERKMNINMPKKLQGIASTSSATVAAEAEEQRLMAKYAEFWQRLEPLMTEIYDLPTYRMENYNKLGGVFIAGAMYCTLLTRCYYRHYDGELQRMNPQVYIIGNPASGKGEAEKLDQTIMAPVIVADRAGRDAEREYKRQSKERSTSSKAQKGEALKRPEFPIRYLPSKTSNAVFYRRQLNAVELVNGEKFPLHLYTFDSELDSNTAAQSSGNWIGKHDIELKAFHNEFTGVDFMNNDSVNDLLQIFYNNVCTGTPLSLNRKVNPRNVNDGLCSRMAIFRMVPTKYVMIDKGNRILNNEKRCKLKEWAFKFDKLQGEMPIRKLVDHVYKLCEQSAAQAEMESDDVLDYLRKRAVFYATWFTVPRILERAVNRLSRLSPNPSLVGRGGDTSKMESSGKKKGMQGYCSPPYKGGAGGESAGSDWSSAVMSCVKVEKSDLDFATLIYDAVIFWQDYFFGRMLQDSWDDAKRDMRQRVRNTHNVFVYNNLQKVFTLKDMTKNSTMSDAAARKQAERWVTDGYIKRKARGQYEKNVNSI